MNHITNEQVFDLIKDIPNLELFLDERVIQWHRGHFTIQSRGIDYILRPEDVLAIIVDAAKREMGEACVGLINNGKPDCKDHELRNSLIYVKGFPS